MKRSNMQRLAPVVITVTLMAAGVVACDDPDTSPTASGGAGGAVKGGTAGVTGKSGAGGAGGKASAAGSGAVADMSIGSKAADLRVSMNLLLSEHLVFAAKATGAALGGRMSEFSAYGALLNSNGTALGDMVGAAFGDAAKTQFNGIWSAHNGFFVDYTTGVATMDEAKKTKAVKDLTETYVPMFATFISDATGLPKDTVTSLTMEHVLQTKAIVDAQAAKDWPKAYAAVRAAFAHMAMIGNPLAEAIAKKFPDKFPGDATTKSVDFRVALNQLLQEHLYLATFATGAALGGRSDEFSAAGGGLNDNGTDIGGVIGDLFGDAAKTSFNGIWSAHNGFFVDYTTGVATKDDAKKTKAVKDLTETYVPMFAKLISDATGLPNKAVTDLTSEHVTTTKDVVDAQAGTDLPKAGDADRKAGMHMQMIGDPLATAIVAKLPTKF